MTRFNIIAGTAVIPLLARLVLCAAFLTAGWNKLMHHEEFTGEQAERLIELGVHDIIREGGTTQPASFAVSRTTIVQDGPLADQDDPVDDDAAPAQDEPAAPSRDHPLELPPDVLVEDPVTGERTLYAKRLHGVTLLLLSRGVEGRWAIGLAWLLALTELVSGGLLLIGLFSRVWAAAIATIMIVAFYLTSLDPFIQHGGPFGLAGNVSAFNRMYAQLGLLVLALTVALAGPGPASIDRLIFRPATVDPEDEYA